MGSYGGWVIQGWDGRYSTSKPPTSQSSTSSWPLFWHHKTRAIISLLITSSYLLLTFPSFIFCSLSCLVSSLITPRMRSLLSHSVPLGRRWVCGCVRGNEQASCFLLSPSRSILSLPMPPPEVWYNCLWKHCLPVISYCSGRVSTKCKTATI